MQVKCGAVFSDAGKYTLDTLAQKQFIVDDAVSGGSGLRSRQKSAGDVHDVLCISYLGALLLRHGIGKRIPSDEQIKVADLHGIVIEHIRIHLRAAQVVKRLPTGFEESLVIKIMAFFPFAPIAPVFICSGLDFGCGHHGVWLLSPTDVFRIHDTISGIPCQVFPTEKRGDPGNFPVCSCTCTPLVV